MGVADTPKYIGAYWTHRERKEPGSSNQKCFDHHALYVGYNVTNFFIANVNLYRLTTSPNTALTKLLLYGDKDFSDSINRSIIQLNINFIHKTGRFGWFS